jgi:hypothetical protein
LIEASILNLSPLLPNLLPVIASHTV